MGCGQPTPGLERQATNPAHPHPSRDSWGRTAWCRPDGRRGYKPGGGSDERDRLVERRVFRDDLFAIYPEKITGQVPAAHVLAGELGRLRPGGMTTQRLLQRHVKVEDETPALMRTKQSFDHAGVAGRGEDALQHNVETMIKTETHGLIDQRRSEPAGIAGPRQVC